MHLLLANISLLQCIDRGTDIEEYVGIYTEIMVLAPTVFLTHTNNIIFNYII